jgi:hypothetical protein
MPVTYKILGQAAPANTSNTSLVSTVASAARVVSSLVITNTSANAASARVFVRATGGTSDTTTAIVYDAPVAPYSTVAYTLGVTIANTDVIEVRSNVANALTFSAFGSEIS